MQFLSSAGVSQRKYNLSTPISTHKNCEVALETPNTLSIPAAPPHRACHSESRKVQQPRAEYQVPLPRIGGDLGSAVLTTCSNMSFGAHAAARQGGSAC